MGRPGWGRLNKLAPVKRAAIPNGPVPVYVLKRVAIAVSTSAGNAVARGSISGPCYIFGVKAWLSTLETVHLLWSIVAQ